MKTRLITLLCLTISMTAFSQNAFYDAQLSNTLSVSEVASFTQNNTAILTDPEIDILNGLKAFLEKPFDSERPAPDFNRVRAILRKIKASTEIAGNTESLVGTQVTSLLIPFSNLSKLSTAQLDTALYGLTIYFANEFRRGYMEAYLRGFERSIGEIGELEVMFPATYQKMRSFDPARFKELGNELKEVFDTDLSTSLEHVTAHIDAAGTSAFPTRKFVFLNQNVCQEMKRSTLYPYLQVSSEIGQKLIRGEHPSDIMGFLDTKYYSPPASNTITSTPLTLTLTGTATVGFSESATVTATTMLTVSSNQAMTLITSDTTTLALGDGGAAEIRGPLLTSSAETRTLTVGASATVLMQGTVSITPTPGKAYTLVAPTAVSVSSIGSITANSSGEIQVAIPTNLTTSITLAGTATVALSNPSTLTIGSSENDSNKFIQLSPGEVPIPVSGWCSTIAKGNFAVNTTASLNSSSDTRRKFGDAIHLYDIVQRNLRDTARLSNRDNPSVWINFEQLGQLKTAAARAYFMALIYKEDPAFFNRQSLIKNVDFKKLASNVTIDTGLEKKVSCAGCLDAFESFRTQQAGELLGKLTKIDEFARLKKDHLTDETNFGPFMKLTSELIYTVFSMAESTPAATHTIQEVVALSDEVFQAYQAVRVKNYSNILLHTTNLLGLFYRNKSIQQKLEKHLLGNVTKELILVSIKKETMINENLKSKAANTMTPKQARNYLIRQVSPFSRLALRSSDISKQLDGIITAATSVSSLTANLNSLTSTVGSMSVVVDNLFRKFDHWSGFTSGVVSATNSQEINTVISRYAAPPSSFIEKRTNPFAISVSGMPGLFTGIEKIDDKSAEPTSTTYTPDNSFHTTVGLSLPIGLDFTRSITSQQRIDKHKGAYSIGLFVQLIDLGSMLNYRLTTNANTLPDQVRLKDIFSPGAMLNAGFPNTPLTIGIGYQYAPALRRISKDNQDAPLLNTHRWQIRVAYDIPLFRIFGSKNAMR